MLLYSITLGFYLILFLVAATNLISQPILKRSQILHDDFVSILIPARNEESNISNIIDSIINQDYKNYDLIILDDDSTDKTADIVKTYSEKYKNIRLVSGSVLPDKWLGKNWACHQLGQIASGKYFMFIDADTIIEDNLIVSSIDFIKRNNLKLLSLFPEQIMFSLSERMTVPLMNNILLGLLPLILIRKNKNPDFAAANGQFMFFEANNYLDEQWHKKVREKVAEDISIIKLMKIQGYSCATLLGNGLIKCRMYKSLNEAVNGFSKNIILMLGDNLFLLFIYLFFMTWILLYFAITGQYSELFNLTILAISIRSMISVLSKQNLIYNIILYPFQLILLNIISFLAIYKKFTKSNIWKERKLNLS